MPSRFSCITNLHTRSIAAPNGSAERICDPMCTLIPCGSSHLFRSRRADRFSAALRMSIPNLCSRNPVEIYGCVSANTSGFTRSANRATIFNFRARAASSSSSVSLSTLNSRMPAPSARSISAAVLPTPENTTRATACGAAAITRSSSPPETMSNPAPRSASNLRIRQRRICLHRIADEMIAPRKRALKHSQPLQDLRSRIHIQRSSMLPRQRLERDPIAI